MISNIKKIILVGALLCAAMLVNGISNKNITLAEDTGINQQNGYLGSPVDIYIKKDIPEYRTRGAHKSNVWAVVLHAHSEYGGCSAEEIEYYSCSHFGIDAKGRVAQFVPLDIALSNITGSYEGSKFFDTSGVISIAISYTKPLDSKERRMSKEAVEKLTDLIVEIASHYHKNKIELYDFRDLDDEDGINSILFISHHRMFNFSGYISGRVACPGNYLIKNLPDIISKANTKLRARISSKH